MHRYCLAPVETPKVESRRKRSREISLQGQVSLFFLGDVTVSTGGMCSRLRFEPFMVMLVNNPMNTATANDYSYAMAA